MAVAAIQPIRSRWRDDPGRAVGASGHAPVPGTERAAVGGASMATSSTARLIYYVLRGMLGVHDSLIPVSRERETMAPRKKLPPIHPRHVLRDELQEIGISLNELARAFRVPMNRISAIVNAKRAIPVDTAMRLPRCLGTLPQYWLNLQMAYDLESAGRRIKPQIEGDVFPRSAA